MKERGYSAAAVKTLWDILLPFSDYAFNKAHSAAYGMLSYWTAYLKANYPAEYMAALLTSVGDDKDKMAIYLAECRSMGIKVLAAGREHLGPGLRAGRHRHPVRPVRGAQRRHRRGRLDRRQPQGQGRLHRLLRLPGEGRPGRLQQEGRRIADQGRRLRLAEPPAQGPADGARQGDRRGARAEEGRGDRPVRPVRRDEPGGEGRLVPRQRPGHRVGHQAAPGIRAGDAGAVRVRASAGRGRAHPVGAVGRVDPGHPGRHRARTAGWSRSAASSPGCSAG